MTGEMAWINQDGLDSNGEIWEIHAEIAKAVGGELKPFDVYQGCYISVGADVVANAKSCYRMPIQHLGCIRLWIGEDDNGCYVYREDTDEIAHFFWNDIELAICAAKSLL